MKDMGVRVVASSVSQSSHCLSAEPVGHTSFGYSAGCGGYRIAGS